METNHCFQPGARVAIRNGHHDSWHETFVEKVYKTGHFTLLGNPQRYRPYSYDAVRWYGSPTRNDGWNRTSVQFWNAATDKEISESIAGQALTDRLASVRKRLERVHEKDVTMEMLAAIEALLLPHPKSGEIA